MMEEKLQRYNCHADAELITSDDVSKEKTMAGPRTPITLKED